MTKRDAVLMGAETYCVLVSPHKYGLDSFGAVWELAVYSWPSESLAPSMEEFGFYDSKEEAVVAGTAAYGKVFAATSEFDMVWNAAWPQLPREKASKQEIAAAESAWRDFADSLAEVPA